MMVEKKIQLSDHILSITMRQREDIGTRTRVLKASKPAPSDTPLLKRPHLPILSNSSTN